jgi:large subunit ribosomal protein L25
MTYSLTAVQRTEKGENVRDAGRLPAVVYGKGAETQSLTLEPKQFLKLYKEAGEASLIDLTIDGKDAGKILVQSVQYNPITDRVIHVDLRRIDMNKPMTATVELRFIGESPVIKASGGTLVTALQSVEVECLPKDLISHIDVDLSVLTTFDVAIKIKDLPVSSGVVITEPAAEVLVVKASPALTEEEIKAMEEASTQPVDLNQIEVAGKKKEAEEGEEGDETKKAEPAEKK